MWILSWILAEAIPVFNDVLGLAVCTHQSLTISRILLTSVSELPVCQLVHHRSARHVLALSKPTSLVHDQESDNLFLHQHRSGFPGISHCEFASILFRQLFAETDLL